MVRSIGEVAAARHLLHVFPAFAVGGQQARFCAVANNFADRYRHSVVSINGDLACRERLSPGLPIEFLPAPPGWRGIAGLLSRLRPDAMITHNWGSMDWAIANWTAGVRHIHIDDGFGPEERDRQLPRRVLTRRLVLRRSTLVLPSQILMRIAREVWWLSPARMVHIPNGIDLARFMPTRPTRPRDAPVVIGTVAALRPEKNLTRLLHAVAAVPAAELVIVGDGPERARLEAEAGSLGLSGRVRFAGHRPDPREVYAGADVFALSSDTEQMPLTVIEAMASGLPIAATDVGDVRAMVSDANAPFVVARDAAALAGALAALVADPAARATVGAANRARAEAAFDEQTMFAAYAALFDR